MWIGLVMVVLGTGSAIGALLHFRDGLRGKPRPYPLLYDLLGAVGFLLFGAGTLLQVPFFTGSGRALLLLLIPVAVLKWRGLLARRYVTRGTAIPGAGEESAGGQGTGRIDAATAEGTQAFTPQGVTPCDSSPRRVGVSR